MPAQRSHDLSHRVTQQVSQRGMQVLFLSYCPALFSSPNGDREDSTMGRGETRAFMGQRCERNGYIMDYVKGQVTKPSSDWTKYDKMIHGRKNPTVVYLTLLP